MSEKVQKFILLTFGVLAMSLAIGYLVFAWVEPTDAPPAGNVPAPINVSTTTQTKLGGFILDTTAIGLDEPFQVRKNDYYFFVGVNRGGGDYIDIGAYHSTLGWRNLVLNRDGGNVGIGDTTPDYKLDVEGGDIYASGYVRGGTGLCIGGDCQTSWPIGGDITAVYAGTGLTGGGTSGDVTLALDITYTDGRYLKRDGTNTMAGDLLPDVAATRDLGSYDSSWQNIFASNLWSRSGYSLGVGADGSLFLGSGGAWRLWLAPDGDLMPMDDNAYYLGDTTRRWQRFYAVDAYFDGNVAIDGNVVMGWEIVEGSCSNCGYLEIPCPTGKKVLGGGCASTLGLNRTFPSPFEPEWVCGTEGTAAVITGYAICARIQ